MHLYQEFPPHPALATHVACFWTSQVLPASAPVRQRILPGYYDQSHLINEFRLFADETPEAFAHPVRSAARSVAC